MLCIAFFRPIFKLGFRVGVPIHFNIALRRHTAGQAAFSGRFLLIHMNHLRSLLCASSPVFNLRGSVKLLFSQAYLPFGFPLRGST